MVTLKINNISKKYGKKKVLDNISLEINSGIFSLLGPNGAGKTTLIRILTSVLKPDNGSITFNEIQWKNYYDIRNTLGYLPQKFNMLKNCSVYEALEYFSILKDIKGNHKQMILDICEKLNVTDYINKNIGKLSGGMLRKVGIAQALLGSPKLIIFDEPTSGLDPAERVRFKNILHSIKGDSIILISTHIVDDVDILSDHVAVINNGKVAAYGKLNEIRDISKGFVWEREVNEEQYLHLATDPRLISCNQSGGGVYRIKYIDYMEQKDAEPASPTLEDSFMYLMKKSQENKYDKI